MKTSSLIIITLILLGFSINTLAEEEKPQDISGSVETFADEESDSNNSETDVVTGEDTSRINTDSEEDETSADNEDSENNMADGSKNPQDNASEDEDSSEESANNSEGLEDSTLTEDDNNENDGSDLANEDSDAESENDDVIVEAQDTNASTIADQVNKIDKINNQAYEGTLTREQVTEELRPINRKQNKKISHPDAKRGLVRITKDNVYVYATKNTPKNKAINVNFGQYSPTGLTNGEQAFSDLYDTGFMIQADKEHPIFKSSLGILSW